MDDIMLPNDPDCICQTLNHSATYFSRCVGYCHHHSVYLTETQLRGKKCIGKHCFYLQKTNHVFWKIRESIKEKKKADHLRNFFTFIPSVRLPEENLQRYVCFDIKTAELTPGERSLSGGLCREVIQIGAVMLDENCTYVSSFSSTVKPLYSHIDSSVSKVTGITKEMTRHADVLPAVFIRYVSWLKNYKVTTYCWGDYVYTQLLNELRHKAPRRLDLQDTLKSFIDLQHQFCTILMPKDAIPLDTALSFVHEKFKGRQRTAVTTAYNSARILHKLNHIPLTNTPRFLYTYKDSNQVYSAGKEKDCIAAFIQPELLEKFGLHKQSYTEKTAQKPLKEPVFITKKTKKQNFFHNQQSFLTYGIHINRWAVFSFRMVFIHDIETADELFT